MTFEPSKNFNAVIAAIDEVNAQDPRTTIVDGQSVPFESAYADRMTKTLEQMYPDASELLRIAARAQHIRRHQFRLINRVADTFQPDLLPHMRERRTIARRPDPWHRTLTMGIGLDAILKRNAGNPGDAAVGRDANPDDNKIHRQLRAVTEHGARDLAFAGQMRQAGAFADIHPVALVQGAEII